MNHKTDLTKLRQDNIFVNVEKTPVNELTIGGMTARKGIEHAIISEGQIVNFVSNQYGLLKNEDLFLPVESALIEADIYYSSETINRENGSFSAKYILNDDRYEMKVKGDQDIVRPMISITNSYDGSCKKSGSFGFWRKVCSNGLHVADFKFAFSVKARGNVSEVVLPKVDILIEKFMSNEYYELVSKFEVLAAQPINDVKAFVKEILGSKKVGTNDLFKFEASEKNPDTPSGNAQIVIDTIFREANMLNIQPNMWLGYNAFNEILHGKLKKTFDQQQNVDRKIFDLMLEVAG